MAYSTINDTDTKPAAGGAPVLNKNANPVNFDVHKDYRWALNATSALREIVPGVTLTEYKVTSSAAARALKLYIAQNTESSVARAALGGQIGSAVGGTFFSPVLGSLGGWAIGAAAGAFVNPGNMTGFTNESPYFGLYEGAATGFVYRLPYLNIPSNMTSYGGGWSAMAGNETLGTIKKGGAAIGSMLPGGSLVGAIGKGAGDAIAKAFENVSSINSTALSLGNPGMSQENIKKFAPNENGETIDLSFYLYNTESLEDIQNNWNFLFTLTYQNLPNRRSLNLMDPPSMYTVEVPNFKYFPAAVVSKLTVTNQGTTRFVDLATGAVVPVQSGSNVKVIPEVYKVDITLQSLLQSSRNLAYYINDSSKDNKIKVIEKANNTK